MDFLICFGKLIGKIIISDELINVYRKYRIENVDFDSNWI